MKSRKITLSLKKIKLWGRLIFFLFLFFFLFALIEGSLIEKASQDTVNAAGTITSPTPFLSENSMPPLTFDVSSQAQLMATAHPAVVYKGGTNPISSLQVLPTIPNISPYSLPAGVNPLTGIQPIAASQLDRRPIAVKITLFPRYVRPQSGISLADVVFEYYTEWGLSRFVGIFYGNDAEAIGPVRSGRYFDAHVARMYQAYLVIKYADKRVLDYLNESDLGDFLIVPDSAVGAIYAGPNIFDNYNNYFFDTFRFQDFLARKEMDNNRPDLRSEYFSITPQVFYQNATHIYTRFSVYDYHYWEYNETLHRYFRFQETDDTTNRKEPKYAPLVDIATDQQVTADNVIILLAPYTFDNQWDKDDEVFHIDLFGSGKAYLFRDGIVLPAHWQRIATNQPLLITDENGVPLFLKPGRTFYEVLGENSTYTENNAHWHFQFETP